MMIRIISSISMIVCAVMLHAQVLYNNNANIFVANGAVVQVNGTAQNASGTIENNGTTNIANDYVNDDITQGTGEYYVTGNWENNATFTANTSHVYLNGANQQITGTQITSFYDLSTTGTGVKTQTIDAHVLNNLDLTDRELATDANVMFVDNINANAISFTTGFVSSDPTAGRLDRATQSTNTYIFPTGSSQGTPRYRPIEITPLNASSNRYAVRFANVSGTSEGYNLTQVDTSICQVLPNWFHIITRPSGATDADVTVYYDQGADGAWSGIAQWNAGPTEWQNTGTVTAGVPAPLENLTKSAWNDWNDDPYALISPNPIFDVVGVDAVTCNLNDGQLNFSQLDPTTSYTVTYDSSGVAVGPISVTSDVSGQFTITTGAGTYTNITVVGGSCNYTHWNTIIINEPAAPTPTISGTLTYCPGNSALLDAGSYSSWLWSTGSTSQTINATIADNPITVTVTDANGCSGTSAAVNVIEDSNPDPGTNGSNTVCSNDPTFDLINFLGGSPDPGGSWSPALTSGTGVFDPSQDAAGTYTYSLPDCGGGTLTAEVVVTINPAPVPGTNGAVTFCDTDAPSDLFSSLGGTPDTGGSWSPALTSGTGVFDPSTDPAGTYTYSVTNSCGTETAEVVVTVDPCGNLTADYTVSDSIICLGDCITFTDASTGTVTSWIWNFDGAVTPNTTADQNPSVCPDSVGTFSVQLVVSDGTSTDTVYHSLVVNDNPTIDAGADTTIFLGDQVTIYSSTPNAGGIYSWQDPNTVDCDDCASINVSPEETTTYTLTYSTLDGCSAMDSVTVTVNMTESIGVPNGFSPNGDANNDVLFVKGNGIVSMNFAIYNRYGQKVFESNDQSNGWDGTFKDKPENPGVFVWYLEYTLSDGTSDVMKGNVTLIK